MTALPEPPEVPAWAHWAHLLNWKTVLTDAEDKEIEWLCWPFIEAGTVSSVYCDPKDGKSLLMQIICKELALGEPVLGSRAAGPTPVLYLDYENPDSIIGERFLDMNATAPGLSRMLYYSNFPAIRPLDTEEGGLMLHQLVWWIFQKHGRKPALIVIDTLSKTIGGSEQSSDTFADIHKYTLMQLRRWKCTVVYLDHSGKDPTAGQRGSSAKPSDVDVVWRLHSSKGERDTISSYRLEPTHSRAGHIEQFSVLVRQEPLRIEMGQLPVSQRALELAAALDHAGVPASASRDECRKTLKDLGITARTSDLAEAVKFRKSGGDNRGDSPPGTKPGTARGQRGQTPSDLLGQSGDSVTPGNGTTSPLFRGDSGQPPDDSYDLNTDASEWAKVYRMASFGRGNKSG